MKMNHLYICRRTGLNYSSPHLWWTKCHRGQVFFLVLALFPCQCHSTGAPYSHVIWGMDNGPLAAPVPQRHSFHRNKSKQQNVNTRNSRILLSKNYNWLFQQQRLFSFFKQPVVQVPYGLLVSTVMLTYRYCVCGVVWCGVIDDATWIWQDQCEAQEK
jgi:hypothetical protein